MALKWRDKRDVHMLSSIHTSAMKNSGKKDRNNQPIMKPHCVLDYTMNMGAVDKVDKQLSFTECIRKTVKWYKKVFFHLMDLSSYNAFAIYRKSGPNRSNFKDFRMQIIRQIFEKYGAFNGARAGRPSIEPAPLRLTERHFPAHIEERTPGNDRIERRRCVVCSSRGTRVLSTFICLDCNAALCVPECFRIYHTNLHY